MITRAGSTFSSHKRKRKQRGCTSFAVNGWREGKGLDGYSCCEIGEESGGVWSVRDCHAPRVGLHVRVLDWVVESDGPV